MGMTILIIFVLAIAGVIVWFFIKNKKEPSVQPEKEKPSEPVSQPSAPPADEVPKKEEKEPEKPKEKPMFKVGDLILNGDVTDEGKPEIFKVLKVCDTWYDVENVYDGRKTIITFKQEYSCRMWNISDAKDGDVLSYVTDGEDLWIMIYWSLYEPYDGHVHYHALLVNDNFADKGTCCICIDNLKPATKEQRDLLFQKMKDAGYTFDFEKKELRKIEPVLSIPKPDDKPKPIEPDKETIEEFESYLKKYSKFAEIEKDSYTYKWFFDLFKEARAQLHHGSCNMLPALLKQENFPTLYEWGDKGDAQKAKDTLIGWLFSLQLAELKPYYRADIFKLGYELGGYDRYTNVYGWKFECDPNVMRILAGAIYPAMKGYCKPITETLRREVEGDRYNSTLQQLYDNNSRDNVAPSAFFTDFRVFMPTAPAPYAPGYATRPDVTFPNEEKDEYGNLKIDRQIHEMIVEMFNLSQTEHFQETVQAIADKEVEAKHLFGQNRETQHYHFHPVFGMETIGRELPDEGTLADFAYLCFRTGSASRGIMQSASVSPVQYGRLRPGCSWNQEAKKNSSSDDRRNILTNFEIEDGDGSPTGYYDANGEWVYKDAIKSPADFEEYQKTHLYANSYPSGHSSGIFCCSMVLMELFPDKADKILKAANQYAVNRTIARYHWTSDTLNGRVLGSATNAICHAASDYYKLMASAREDIGMSR